MKKEDKVLRIRDRKKFKIEDRRKTYAGDWVYDLIEDTTVQNAVKETAVVAIDKLEEEYLISLPKKEDYTVYQSNKYSQATSIYNGYGHHHQQNKNVAADEFEYEAYEKAYGSAI